MFQKINKKYFFAFIVFIIVFLSVFPRSVEVLNGNPIFGIDQGREMIAAKNIVVDHKLRLIGTELGASGAGIIGLFHGPMYYYMLTIPFILFNGNPVGPVWMMFFLGLLTVAFGYFFGEKIYGRYFGLLLAFLISVSPSLVSQSRFQWSPNPPTFFIMLSLYFTYFINSKNKLTIFFAAFFAAFVYNFEFAIAVPMSLALLLYSVFLFKKNIKNYLFLFSGFVLAFLPMIFFEIRHGFMGLRGVLNYLTNQNSSSGQSLLSFIPDHIKYFIYNFKDTFSLNNFYFALILFILTIILSVYFLNKEKNNNLKYFLYFLIFLIPVNFFVFSFLKNTIWNYYLTDLTLSYIFLFSYIVYAFFKLKNIYLRLLPFILIFIFFFAGFVSAIKTSVYDYSDYGGTAKLKGEIDAIDYIYKDAKGKPFGLLVFSPPVYTYPYDYLIWWYGQKKYGYVPYGEKRGTFYLLIQPDWDKPWSYKGWLETVIKSGKIESTVTLPNGFIVQKRIQNG